MEIVVEVTYDADDLYVGLAIYDVTTGTPVQVGSVVAMTLLAAGLYTYFGKFTADADKQYVVNKAVYTDNTYTTVDTSYSQGSDSVINLTVS